MDDIKIKSQLSPQRKGGSTLPSGPNLGYHGSQSYFGNNISSLAKGTECNRVRARTQDEAVGGSSLSFLKLIRMLRKKHPLATPGCVRTTIDHETGERIGRGESPVVTGSSTRRLKKKGVSFTADTLVWDAIAKGSAYELDTLLTNNDIDITQLSPNGETLLHRAAAEGNIDVIKVIVRHGGDPNRKNADGWPPVHTALQQARLSAVIYLIECGTDMADYTKLRVKEFKEVQTVCSQVYREEEVFV